MNVLTPLKRKKTTNKFTHSSYVGSHSGQPKRRQYIRKKWNQSSGFDAIRFECTNLITNPHKSSWHRICWIRAHGTVFFLQLCSRKKRKSNNQFVCYSNKIAAQIVSNCTEHLIVAQRNRVLVIFNQYILNQHIYLYTCCCCCCC